MGSIKTWKAVEVERMTIRRLFLENSIVEVERMTIRRLFLENSIGLQ